jgi:exopolyphosphatase/guanosine-5'-triphosphate,3'-diphosphate pyrophosphatase
MNFSQGALREGVLYDILGRSLNQDVRDTTMVNLARRHFADEQQSKRVYASAMAIFDQVAEDWFLAKDEYKRLLGWAAIVHEIGLNVSYAHNNEHAAYILSNSELAGFSHDQKMALASVVRGCRRKFQVALYHDIGSFTAATLRKLSRILRIAIIFNKERVGAGDIDFKVSVAGENMNIELPGDNSTQSTLFGALLEEETKYLQYVGFQLSINE